ncbi:MAG: DUF87 domain-containing protein [Actinomycetota bacterium]
MTEHQPSSVSTSLMVSAARQLDQESRAAVAESISAGIVGLLGLDDTTRFVLGLGSEADSGLGVIGVTVEGADGSISRYVDGLADELDIAFVVARGEAVERAALRWGFSAVRSSRTGFQSTAERQQSDTLVEARGIEGDEFRVLARAWLALCARHPGLRLDLSARFSPESGSRRAYRVTPSVNFDGELPLRARALLRRMLPELELLPFAGPDGITLALDAERAAAVLQLPVAGREPLPGIRLATARLLPMLSPGEPAKEGAFRVGTGFTAAGKPVEVCLEEYELTRHTHVVGQTGVGKSTFLAALAHGYAVNGKGMLVIDPHGTLVDRILAELPEPARDRTWVIRAGDLEHPVPLNALATVDAVQLDIVIQDLVLIFYKLFDPRHTGIVGPRFEAFLTNGLRGLHALKGTRASLLDVPRVYRDRDLERAVADAVTDPQLVDFWRREMREFSSSSRSEVIGWVTSKFDRFGNTAAMRGILGSGADAFDPALAMDEHRIILLDLSKGKLGEVASHLLGFLYLTRFWSAMPNRLGDDEFGFIVDEVQSFSASSLPSLLSEGRKWGAAVTVAHQHLSQLDPELLDSLTGNVATTAAFRSGLRDAPELANLLGPGVSIETLTGQPDFHAILSRRSGSSTSRAHSLRIDHGDRVRPRTGAALNEWVRSIDEQSWRDLVEPHRESTSPAAPLPVKVPPPPAREGAVVSSFLDDWLTEHTRPRTGARRTATGGAAS